MFDVVHVIPLVAVSLKNGCFDQRRWFAFQEGFPRDNFLLLSAFFSCVTFLNHTSCFGISFQKINLSPNTSHPHPHPSPKTTPHSHLPCRIAMAVASIASISSSSFCKFFLFHAGWYPDSWKSSTSSTSRSAACWTSEVFIRSSGLLFGRKPSWNGTRVWLER